MRGEPPAARARAVEEVALALAIPHLLDRTVDTLSGGELQRVALAAALVTRPRLVLLDEPTSQLDPVAGDELIWLLRRLNEEWGVAVLLAEHRLERCLAAADRVSRWTRARSPSTAAHATSSPGRRSADPALATPPRGSSRSPGSSRCRSASARRARSLGAAPGPTPRLAPARDGSTASAAEPSGREADADAALDVATSGSSWSAGDEPHDVLRGLDLRGRAGRAGRADGPQRRRQEHPAAHRRRACVEPVRGQDRGAERDARC